MTTKILKKALGEAGAFIDDSSGKDNLIDVLTALASLGEKATGAQAAPAVAVLESFLADKTQDMDASLQFQMGTTGTAGSATANLKVAGVVVATATIASTELDGTTKAALGTVSVKAGELVELDVSAIPTAGADLVATGRLKPVSVE